MHIRIFFIFMVLVYLLLTRFYALIIIEGLDQGHREFPFGNSREFPGIADPQIPGGNSREFLIFWRELRGISRVSFFSIFIVDYDILVFNLTAF